MTGKRILIIEDEVLLAMDMQHHLKKAGAAEIEYAATEKEALGLLKQRDWDAVVADANLHGRSIATLAAVLRERGVPFVIVTGYARETLPPELAAEAFLAKPFSPVQLVQAVSRLFAS
jgi:CheY-like chemotaxis protein